MKSTLFFAAALAASCDHAAAAAAAADDAPAIVARYALGGDGGWDYLTIDATARRVYVTRGEHVMVVDADNGKLVGDIAGVKHAHGVALVPAANRGYVSNGHGNSVTVFDLKSLAVLGEYKVGKDPDAILFDASSDRVFAFNGHGNDASVIEPATGRVMATIKLPGRPEFAVADGKGRIYLNLEDKSQLVEIDAAHARVLHAWPLAPCKGPTGLALDGPHRRLFSTCANGRLVVVNADSGSVVATLPVGADPDGAAFDAESNTIYSSNSDGTLTMIREDDPDHYRVIANVATPKRSKTIALDPTTHRVYLGAAKFGAAPAPTTAEPEPKGAMEPGSFELIVIGAPH